LDSFEPGALGHRLKRRKFAICSYVIDHDCIPSQKRAPARARVSRAHTTKAVQKIQMKTALSDYLQPTHFPIHKLDIAKRLPGNSETPLQG